VKLSLNEPSVKITNKKGWGCKIAISETTEKVILAASCRQMDFYEIIPSF
jgi:nitrogen fixation protein